MARYAWCGDYNEASTFLDLFTTYSGHNDSKFDSPEYDKLMKDAKTMADPNPNYTAAEAILTAEMPIIPIYHYAKVDMVKPDIKGLPQNNVHADLVRQRPVPRSAITLSNPDRGGPLIASGGRLRLFVNRDLHAVLHRQAAGHRGANAADPDHPVLPADARRPRRPVHAGKDSCRPSAGQPATPNTGWISRCGGR